MKKAFIFFAVALVLFVSSVEICAIESSLEKDPYRDLKVTVKENGSFYYPPTSNWPQVLLLDEKGYVKKTAKGQNPVTFSRLERKDRWGITVKVDEGYWFKREGIGLSKYSNPTAIEANIKWTPAKITVNSTTGKAKDIQVYRKIDGQWIQQARATNTASKTWEKMKPGDYKVVWDGGSDWMKGTAEFSIKAGKSATLKFPGSYVPNKVEIKVKTNLKADNIWVYRKSRGAWRQEWRVSNKNSLILGNRTPGTYKILAKKNGYLPAENIVTIPQGKIETVNLSFQKLVSPRVF